MKMSRNAATLNVSFEANFESFPSHLSIVQVNVVTRDVNTKFSKYLHKNVTLWDSNKVLTVVVNLLKGVMNSFKTRDTLARCTRHALPRARAPRNHMSTKPIERMHSRAQQSCKFIGTKESADIRKELNSHRIGLVQQHGAVSLFWKTNMAVMTSCAYALQQSSKLTIRTGVVDSERSLN